MNELATPMTAPAAPAMLRPGENCWRVERADRAAVLIDGEAYFAAARKALLAAQRQVLLLGWNFAEEARLPLRETQDVEWPREIGALLHALVERRPELRIDVILWDNAEYLAVSRRRLPGLQAMHMSRMGGDRLNYVLDDAHPPLTSHHQKVLVVDDAIAFCGGFDFAGNRWDTRRHDPDEPRRRMPSGATYDAHHDVMLAVDGAAAGALGDLARERLRHATGEVLSPPPRADVWPSGLATDFTGVDVGIARTAPALGDRPEIREAEALYLDSIAAARRTIYAESQYLASHEIGAALAARLGEPDGPEVVIVNPKRSPSWTEQVAMDNARTHVTHQLRTADRYGRFRLFAAVNDGREIVVHSKLMVVDDRLLRIGSSNLNSRSMGADTECDLAIEAGPEEADDASVRDAIVRVRDDLVAEHMGTTRARVAAAVAESGSLIGAIEALNGQSARRLASFPPPQVSRLRHHSAHNALTDPRRAPPRGLGLAVALAVGAVGAWLVLRAGRRRR